MATANEDLDFRLVEAADICAGGEVAARACNAALLRRPDVRGARCADRLVCRRPRASPPRTRTDQGGRGRSEFVAETKAWLGLRNVSVDDVQQLVGERRGFRRWFSTLTLDRASRSNDRGRGRPPAQRAHRRAADVLQRLAVDQAPREPPTAGRPVPVVRIKSPREHRRAVAYKAAQLIDPAWSTSAAELQSASRP